MLAYFGKAIAILLVIAFAAATLLPVLNTPAWWIRGLEFPRIHFLLAVPLVVALVWWSLRGWLRWLVLAILLAATAYQGAQVFPFTPLATQELQFVEQGSVDDVVTVVALNVLMENDDHAAVAERVRQHDPDILLLMETDKHWVQALAPLLDDFGHVIRHPKDNHYGMIFATNLAVQDARVEYLTVEDTPSIFAELQAPDGTAFRFVGLHPRPPMVGVDTEQRDDQLYYAARFARDINMPVVVMGDFNAVAWSHTTQTFKRVGGYLDPRIGRRPMPSFDAESRIMRFPIDQLYVTRDVGLVDFFRGAPVGSDHFPIIAELRFDAALARRHNRQLPPPTAVFQAEIEKRVARHQRRLDAVDREAGD